LNRLRVLITNNSLAERSGSELYVRDLALALLKRGHHPVAYSMRLGDVAAELRGSTVVVVDRLDQMAEPPDVIHGQHHYETMTALLHFPGVPAVSVCHGWSPWQEAPPKHPRILRYVAVDDTCRDRLTVENGIPSSCVDVMLNFVDLERFRPRSLLPSIPRKALVFSNQLNQQSGLPALRAACEARGLSLDVAGFGAGNPVACPEDVLGDYDLVFGKARCALEALAVGCAVIACDAAGLAGMVSSSNFEAWRRLNFGIRSLRRPLEVGALIAEIDRYDMEDATLVSQRLRQVAGLGASVDAYISLYERVIAEFAGDEVSAGGDLRAAAAYLREWGPKFKNWTEAAQLPAFEARLAGVAAEIAQAEVRQQEGAAALAASRATTQAGEVLIDELRARIVDLEQSLTSALSGLEEESAESSGLRKEISLLRAEASRPSVLKRLTALQRFSTPKK
jgi:hypothetical protein